MKKIMRIAMMLMPALMLTALPLFAARTCPVSFAEYDKLVQSNMQDQCLLTAKNCAFGTDSVQQRLDTLRVELAKGRYVYSPAELQQLRHQLQWITRDSANPVI